MDAPSKHGHVLPIHRLRDGMNSKGSHVTSRLARAAAAGPLIAAAAVAYWAWRSDDARSNPNVVTRTIAEPDAAPARDLPANATPYRTGIEGVSRVGAGTGASGGAVNLNTGVLSGSSFHTKLR